MKCKCVRCGINPQNQKCKVFKDFLNSLYGKTAMNGFQEIRSYLKPQLAENQKKKEDFKSMYFNKCLDYEHLREKFDDKCAEFDLKEYDYKQTIFEKDQDKISFAVDILEELADCSNYINSKLDFECGFYVSEKAIRDKIKYLKGKVEDVKDLRRKQYGD